ncbi:MAG TPA: GIY-YIG nuclease family protein [Candidatus Gastranaerophilaceae bacterium]|nr:GIY-YIG nuclease family protein [Candidatus Gastranaerophilaceae bacterium]
MKQYYVYILTNYNRTVFYTGVTSDLIKRAYEHNNESADGFTKKYHIKQLLFYEIHYDILEAISREKTIKRWKRAWKWNLIKDVNPNLVNLYDNGNILPLPLLTTVY